MVAMIVFYFSSAPVMQRVVRFNPLTPQRIAEKTRRSYGFYFRRAVSTLFQRRAFVS